MSSTLGVLFVLIALLISGSFSHRHGHDDHDSSSKEHEESGGDHETDDKHGDEHAGERREDFKWSDTKPTSCPYEDPETHICSSLISCNGTCLTIRCCSSFNQMETPEEYDGDSEKDDGDSKEYDGDSKEYDGDDDEEEDSKCSLCIAYINCTVYKCRESCCSGYERDAYGRCINESGRIQCENGGTAVKTYWGLWACRCRVGFSGVHCESPVCQCDNGGYCVSRYGQSVCECTDGYFGERCEQYKCEKNCMNGGTCLSDGKKQTCLCPKSYVGENCEKKFVNSAQCPYNNSHTWCQAQCDDDGDCLYGHICCQEGCSMMCRLPARSTCKYNDKVFAIGESYKPNSCMTCNCTETGKMMCMAQTCAYPACANGQRPVVKPGVCCPFCPGEPAASIRFLNCPNETLTLDVSESDKAVLNTSTMRLVAVDAIGGKNVEVHYRPSFVKHCHCKEANTDKQTVNVTAYAKDDKGNMASCQFNVKVRDVSPPVMKSCPNDIYVFDDEPISWSEPVFCDNVGIAKSGYLSKHPNNMEFPLGSHKVIFGAVDYDGNRAMCAFLVSVTSRSTDWEDMPPGLRARSTGDKPDLKRAIIGAVVGAAALVIIALVALVLCCRRRSNNASALNAARSHVGSENIYVMPGDINPKLAMHKGHAVSLPPYSVNGDMKDGTYAYVAPPAYTESNDGDPKLGNYINPGYETLKVYK